MRTALQELGFEVMLKYELTGATPHADTTPDPVWLREAGRRGLVIVTADRNITRRPLEREALRAAGTWAFVLTARDQSHRSIVAVFEQQCASIRRLVCSTKPPAVWRLNRAGIHVLGI